MKVEKINANTYNKFCYSLDLRIGHLVATIKTSPNGERAAFYDRNGTQVATYDERKGHGLIYWSRISE